MYNNFILSNKFIKTYQFFHGFINDILNFDVMKFVVITELFDDKRFTRGRWTQNTGSKWLDKNDYDKFCKNTNFPLKIMVCGLSRWYVKKL